MGGDVTEREGTHASGSAQGRSRERNLPARTPAWDAVCATVETQQPESKRFQDPAPQSL